MKEHPLEALAESYLKQKNIALQTLKTYRIVLKKYIEYLKAQEIEFATTTDVINYRESNRELGHSTAWLYIQMTCLKGFYRYLSQNQKRLDLPVQYLYDIVEPVKVAPVKPGLTKPVLSVKQAKQLLLKTKENRKFIWDYRDHAIVYLMLTGGMRSFEIAQAKRCDLKDVDGKHLLYIRNNSASKTLEFIKLSRGAFAALDDYLKLRKDDNPYLFIPHKNTSKTGGLGRLFFGKMFERVLKTSGLEDTNLTPHSLRHTAATLNLLRGGSIESTKGLLRHTEISSTMVYVDYLKRLNDDFESQIEAFILKEDASLEWEDLFSPF
jgi:site-specific recombinase XerD